MTDNLMNESRLIQIDKLNAKVNKTRSQDRNNFRPVPLIFELTINKTSYLERFSICDKK